MAKDRKSTNDDNVEDNVATNGSHAVIDLLSDSDDNDEGRKVKASALQGDNTTATAPAAVGRKTAATKTETKTFKPKARTRKLKMPVARAKELQAGLVLEEDIDSYDRLSSGFSWDSAEESSQVTVESYIQQQQEQVIKGKQPVLYHDPDFEAVPSSINGANKKTVEKCRCSPAQPASLSYKQKGPNKDRPYYHCARNKCRYFKWAFNAEKMHWYRFGLHNNHVIVGNEGFSAADLLQGKVGDCWFLSALAVIAERPDLIMRLFGNGNGLVMNEYGIVEVTLFLDGFWKKVVMDNFLPCIIEDKAENELQRAIQASLGGHAVYSFTSNVDTAVGSSKYDPHALSDKNREVLTDTNIFLQQDQVKKMPFQCKNDNGAPRKLNRMVTSDDLAYSKAKKNQLWVPLLEKAYAKSHGCYQAISGGHIAEAFLDLTGAPTLVYDFDSPDFHARSFWSKLLSYRKQRLPMGCGTSSSAAGIIGMHAYSILDVREIKNVCVEFFRDKLLTGTMGNVSGFTDFDGTVRLLRIRNPHGRGEWKGEFSDKSDTWERLLAHQGQSDLSSPGLQRTMKNDGTFWIDYDNFLMGFSNVDVVLAFMGNHAKSFASNFPVKKSNHRCTRAFEVSLLDEQPGVPARDTVELYIMGIQATRRGAYHGRTDRKKSYKVCDLGMIIGKNRNDNNFGSGKSDDEEEGQEFDTVEGQMFGFRRNGHYRLILNRKKNNSLVVMPISFGHPAATDKNLSFVLRFVSDAPLLIRELPNIPRMDLILQKFCLEPNPLQMAHVGTFQHRGMQGMKKLLLDDSAGRKQYGEPLFQVLQIDYLGNGGGTVFVYLCVNDNLIQRNGIKDFVVSFSMEANCRGMMCRTENGFLPHETVSKGKKFEAAWRRYTNEFTAEDKSRLLMVLVQSGQDTEMGSIKLVRSPEDARKENNFTSSNSVSSYFEVQSPVYKKSKHHDYEKNGIFNGLRYNCKGEFGFGQAGGDVGDVFSLVQGPDDADIELERALALSRGDLEAQQALERSKQDSRRHGIELPGQDLVSSSMIPTQDFEQDLERAILESAAMSSETPQTSFSQEIEEAMKLSLKESRRSFVGSDETTAIVDLVSNGAAPGSAAPSIPNAKRRKTDQKFIEITDDASCQEKKPSANQDEKRKLVAEAAMKRLHSVEK